MPVLLAYEVQGILVFILLFEGQDPNGDYSIFLEHQSIHISASLAQEMQPWLLIQEMLIQVCLCLGEPVVSTGN